MTRFLLTALAIVVSLVLFSSKAKADSITFTADLTPGLEVPPTDSQGIGFASAVVDTAANTLFVDVTFIGLTTGTTASHIHCCVDSPFLNANAGVATQVPTFVNLPLGVTSGSFTQTLDLTQASSYNPAFITAEGGTVPGAESALVTGMENGESYLNIHTTQFPGGEIRGQLSTVPEPSTIFLIGAGLLGIVAVRRKYA